MTLIWLIVWLFSDTPQLENWNAWVVSLIVCAVLDFSGGATKASS